MLKDLKITNGDLELAFNEYIYEYTVLVSEDVNELEMTFDLDNDCSVKVLNNEINDIDNIVNVVAYNKDSEQVYTLYVHKNTTKETLGIENYKQSLEVVDTEDFALYHLINFIR